MRLLIGLTGKAGSGKDTAAELMGLPTYAFAKPIKEACKVIFGWTDAHVHGALKELIDPKYGVSPRHAMQILGTQWGRNMITHDIWLQRAEHEIAHADDITAPLVITDVRFDNEALLIRKYGGIIINIERPSATPVKAHESEGGVIPEFINHTIVNDGTLHDLLLRLQEITSCQLHLK